MKKIYEQPKAIVTTFETTDSTNALIVSNVGALTDVIKDSTNTFEF